MHRLSTVVVAGAAATGIAGVSAASLGGASDQTVVIAVVAACDGNGFGVQYETLSVADPIGTETALVADVTIAGVASGCSGHAIDLVLTDRFGDVLDERSDSVSLRAGEFTVDVSDAEIDAARLAGISITITDTTAGTIIGTIIGTVSRDDST